jgi:hypothetical protein
MYNVLPQVTLQEFLLLLQRLPPDTIVHAVRIEYAVDRLAEISFVLLLPSGFAQLLALPEVEEERRG